MIGDPPILRSAAPPPGKAGGFTLLELMIVILLVGLLFTLVFSGVQTANASAKRAGCVSNLSKIGTLMGVYAADHNGQWPCYVQIGANDSRITLSTYSDSRNRYRGFVISAVGAIAPYAKDNGVFFCPADKVFTNAYKKRNFETEDAYSSYVTRGRNTTGSSINALGPRLGDVASSAIMSCYFLAVPGNASYPVSHHKDQWPVLFGDGHVTIVGRPDWLDLGNIPKVNDNPPNQVKFWRHFDSRR